MDKQETEGFCPTTARATYTAEEALVVENDAGNAVAAHLTAALETLLAASVVETKFSFASYANCVLFPFGSMALVREPF